MADISLLKKAVGELDEETVVDVLKQVMAEGGGQAKEAMTACQDGLSEVGEKFETGEYFVGDLIFAGELMTETVEILRPALVSSGETDSNGGLLLCTVKGDLHDIGKNIVKSMLEAASFEILDLGVDVPPEKIVAKAKENNIKIIALSGVLTLAIDAMKATVDEFVKAGMREDVKIIIGGIPASEEACRYTGADDWAYSPQKGVNACLKWARE